MKKGKKYFLIILGVVLTVFVIILAIRWNKLDNTLLYSDCYGVISGEKTDVVFSVLLSQKYPEETKVELYVDKALIGEMNDNGENGDEIAGDHIYSCKHSVELNAGEFQVFHAKYKNKKTDELTIRGFDIITEESYENSSKVVSEITSVADKFVESSTGYIEQKNVKKSVNEVCKAAKKAQKSGEVLDVENNGNSALMRTSNGIWYVYQPKVEGIDALGTNVDLDIITIQPWYNYGSKEQIRHYEYVDDAAYYADKEFDNLRYSAEYKDRDVTLDVLKSLKKDEVILITTHGCSTNTLGPILSTGEECSFSDNFSLDAINGRVTVTGGKVPEDRRIAITGLFIKEYIYSLEHSFVYLGACESFKDSRLAHCFLEKGADVVMGYTETVNSIYNRRMLYSIIERMCHYFEDIDEYGNIGHALYYARDIHGVDDSKYKNYSPSKLIYYGNQNYRFYNKYLEKLAEYVKQSKKSTDSEIEQPECPVEKPDFPITVYGNYLLYYITGHGLAAYFEDKGSDEANQEAKLQVMEYANAYVSGDDTVFTEKNLGQIKPVSASSLKAKMFVNRTILAFFDDSHGMGEEQARWRYFIFLAHNFEPESENEVAKPAIVTYRKRSFLEWMKVLVMNEDPDFY